jgi:hypothetical protein
LNVTSARQPRTRHWRFGAQVRKMKSLDQPDGCPV